MALYLDMCVVIISLRQQNINKKLHIGMEESVCVLPLLEYSLYRFIITDVGDALPGYKRSLGSSE